MTRRALSGKWAGNNPGIAPSHSGVRELSKRKNVMSIAKRMFDDPANTYIVDNNSAGAFDKRFAGTPGTHIEQRCCGDRAPFWDSWRIDGEGSTAGQHRYLASDPYGLPPGGNPYPITKSTPLQKTDTLIEGPNSEYRPPWVTQNAWFADWQGLRWEDSRVLPNGLPSPGHWVKDDSLPKKMRWGDYGGWEFLWCNKCETGLEKAWSETLRYLPLAARGISMIVSYVPVLGTAISFAINTTVTLAQGGSIPQAVLDGIGGALPGQPTSGMAFNLTVAIARGERIDKVLIASLPVPQLVKDVITTCDDILYGIAAARNFTQVAYDAIRNQLSAYPEVQTAINYAYRIAKGENVAQLILTEAEQMVVRKIRAEGQALIDMARAQGEQALGAAREKAESIIRQYALETGYQIALMKLPVDMRDAIQTGLVVGVYESTKQSTGTFGSVGEDQRAVPANNEWESKGYSIVYGSGGSGSGTGIAATVSVNPVALAANDTSRAKFGSKYVADLLMQPTFSIRVDDVDSLTGTIRQSTHTDQITQAWTRGFLIGMGACQGKSKDSPDQVKIYQSLAEQGGRAGFQAGQAVQFWRTANGLFREVLPVTYVADALLPTNPNVKASTTISTGVNLVANEPVKSLGRKIITTIVSEGDYAQLRNFAEKGAAIARTNPQVASVRTLMSDGNFRWGFDVATGLCVGMSVNGPGQDRWCSLLGPPYLNGGPDPGWLDYPGGTHAGTQAAMGGFRAGQALQYGLTKNMGAPPAVAAGNALVQGLTNGGFTADTKAGVVNMAQNNPAIAAGANAAVKENTGFFHSILVFFGLA